MIETATLVRLAPWLTTCIFLWSLVAGLLGEVRVPTLHRTEAIRLDSSSQEPSGYLNLWQEAASQQDMASSNSQFEALPHEGRLLQLLDDASSAPQDSANSSQLPHAHELPQADNLTAPAQSQSGLLHAAASHRSGHPSLLHTAVSAQSHNDSNISDSAALRDRMALDSSAAANNLELVRSNTSTNTPANSTEINPLAARNPNQSTSHPNGTVSLSSITHSFNLPNFETCLPNLDLPIPGMDIAPANQSRCYPHPVEYKNSNYLNDSYYMLYHHDLPTTDPHHAFHWGDISRFSRVMLKMKRNDPLKAIFVGGSVSSSYCKTRSVTCWVKPVSEWLLQQNPNVKIINNAVGGTTSRTTAECFDAMVGKDADLIFLEYSYNDRFGVDPREQQEGYELLVRKLLKLPHKPAVLVVHWWGPRHDCVSLVSKAEAKLRAQEHTELPLECAMTLWNSTEDRIQTIVQHYGVQSVSFRNAYWAEIDAEIDGYLPEQTLMPDMIHPSMHGVKLLGGLVIKFLTDAGVHMTQLGQKSHPSASLLPSPLYIEASLDEQSSTCTRGDALQDMMMQKEDWYWVVGKKPGFQTETPGASLVLMVTLPTASSISNLSLGYLASYEGMGWASVECLGACTCPLMKIDANSSARASQEHFATVGIERQNEGDGCLLKVANLHQSSALDGGHKFKVSSVAWTHDGTPSEVLRDAALQGNASLHAHGKMPSVAWVHEGEQSGPMQPMRAGGADSNDFVGHVVMEARAILESQGR